MSDANWNYPIYEPPAQQWIHHLEAWARGEALDINYDMCHGKQNEATSRLTADLTELRQKSGSPFSERVLQRELHERGITAVQHPLMASNGRVYLYVVPLPELDHKVFDDSCKILNPKTR